ncbi:hypothetical protein J3459_011867 [Metarhizium acridum]|uniref:F-box domain-containing protein n=1 Tax=Metarhizium acridum (strain CQMa 102) TaxID=655827 RepID=E9EG71_METAQ|nr:uncharacterized protein MAC_08869 [Metarhizium acridum CQMa 102]EFY85109.1 hypothetical protein MAC_08869 [Metarhizium acridum CQMa 102]KAG8418947.1 hypothetical protein J3459_011867 [Metarhizium acridum]
MGTRGLKIVRFRGRYYIYYNQFDSYFEGLGAEIVASVPTEPDKYQEWLTSMRAQYAAKQRALEQHVYEIRDGSEPDYSFFDELEVLPSELQRLDDFDAEYFYIINLDHEVLTINFSIHWQLGNIPRKDQLWLRAIADSIYPFKPTISLDLCPQEHMASLALKLPRRDRKIAYDFDIVTPNMDIAEPRKAFLTSVLARIMIDYKDTIVRFGREWSPDSFPFRELAFALVSIASGQAKFHSFPAQPCNPRSCCIYGCKQKHLPKSSGCLGQEWAGDCAPLLEFGSMSHRPGDPPGTSPMETMYWHEDVLVSLTLVVDGKAITNAVAWGINKRRASFQVVVLSLFEVSFADVFLYDDDEPLVEVSKSVNLSPLRAKYCVSTHPRERPELKPDREMHRHSGELLMEPSCIGTEERLRTLFPGLAVLVNFFQAAASRRAASKPLVLVPLVNSLAVTANPSTASKSPVALPSELHDRILDFVDYDTWKTCLVVSPKFRRYCLSKYRLDNQTSIVAGPFVEYRKFRLKEEPLLSFDFEDMQTGRIFRMMQDQFRFRTKQYNWMPLIGSDRKALMLDTVVQFEPVQTETLPPT